MAVLVLSKCWVNRLDTGEAVSAQSAPERARSHSMAGEVRSYAGGRQRAITTLGERGQFEVTLRLLSLATIDVLRSWIGIPVQIRDHRGQRLVGVFFEVPIVEQRPVTTFGADYDVKLALATVSIVDSV